MEDVAYLEEGEIELECITIKKEWNIFQAIVFKGRRTLGNDVLSRRCVIETPLKNSNNPYVKHNLTFVRTFEEDKYFIVKIISQNEDDVEI